MRVKATRWAPESTTAILICQPRRLLSATAACIACCAFCMEIGAPYGVLLGIFSGTSSVALAAGVGGCCAAAWPATNTPVANSTAIKVQIFIWISSRAW